jgi:hypothetical protein
MLAGHTDPKSLYIKKKLMTTYGENIKSSWSCWNIEKKYIYFAAFNPYTTTNHMNIEIKKQNKDITLVKSSNQVLIAIVK